MKNWLGWKLGEYDSMLQHKYVMSSIKHLAQLFFERLGKRIVSINAPAKSYEYGMFFLKRIINPPTCIIDIGVGDGTPALIAAFPYEEFQYVLVEPNPKFFWYLDAMQKKHPKVLIEKSFCGESEATTNFFINESGMSSRYKGNPSSESINVPMKTLDAIVSKNHIKGPFFLKIDVEGAEIDVLKGGVQTLKICDVVVLETWINVEKVNDGRDFASIVQFMKENGFVVFDFFGGHTHKNGVLKQLDAVFVRYDNPCKMKRA